MPRVVLLVTEEQDNTPGTATLSMQLQSLQLQPCLGCWQMSQSQESGRSAGTQSCPFVPAGMGLMALPGLGRPPCALLLCIHEPR